jgi:hypothetical protein
VEVYESVSKSFRTVYVGENWKWYSSLPLDAVVSLFFFNQSSEFCRHNPLCCFSTSVYCCCCCSFRYRLSPETFGYILVPPLPQYAFMTWWCSVRAQVVDVDKQQWNICFSLSLSHYGSSLAFSCCCIVSKSFRIGHLELELQMVQLSATRCGCIAIL